MTHKELVRNLKKKPQEITLNMTVAEADMIHMVMGICGETGELLDIIKKHTMYKKPLDMQHVVEELGDIEFYLEGLRQTLGVNRDVILAENIKKLSKRYSDGVYSNDAAINRADKEKGQ